MEYFSHDYNPREDEKIKNLMFKHGWIGYGIFWGLVESLYQNDGFMQLHYERIAFEMRIDIVILKSIINEFGLFKIKDNAFYSESVMHRLKLRKGKTFNAKKAAKARWNKNIQNDANALQTQSNSNAIKEKKRKEKESKEIYIPEFLEFKNYALENQSNTDLHKLELKYKAWKENRITSYNVCYTKLLRANR